MHSTISSVREIVLFTPARLIQFLLLILLTQSAGGNSVVKMELKAGLGGQAVVGRATEIKIQLFTTSPVEGELEIMDANGLTTLPIQLDEQREKTLWLPVTPQPHRPIKVRLVTSQGKVIEKQLTFEQSPPSLTIISSTIPVDQTLERHQQSIDIMPVILSTNGLPHMPQAYAGIDAMIVDPQSLSSLSQDQYHALDNYLSRCGIMLLSAAYPSILERLQTVSGCNGRFIHTYESLSQITSILLKLRTKRPPKPPAPQDLMPLGQTRFQRQMISSLSLYLAGYILFIALVTWRMKKTQYILLLPILVAGAGSLAWSGSGNHQLITWAESESGAKHIQVTSLLLLGGNRRGENRFTLGPETHISNFRGKQSPSIRYREGGAYRALIGHTHLLSPQAYALTSITRRSSQFRLTMKDGYPEVIFLGEASPSETRLLWHGQAYTLPVLSKDDHWQPDKTLHRHPASQAERLLNRHLAYADPALLLPFTPDSILLENPGIQTSGWLVIRHDPEQVL